jgi:hypothetical protein
MALLFDIILEVLINEVRPGKAIRGIYPRKKERKHILFTGTVFIF